MADQILERSQAGAPTTWLQTGVGKVRQLIIDTETFRIHVMDGVNAGGHPVAMKTDLNSYAPLNSPALTGTPTAPTAAAGTNTTQVATTAFVQGEVSAKVDPILQAFQDFADEHGITVPETTNTEGE